MKTCSVEECKNKHYGKGYCSKHLQQIYRFGEIPTITTRTPNEIILKENHAEIILRNRKNEEVSRALINLEDVEMCKQYKWCTDGKYIANHKYGKLHRLLLNVTDSKIYVDHKNHNTLDNRKENLRICSISENQYNRLRNKKGTSKYKGITWRKTDCKWQAQIGYKNKRFRLGLFSSQEEAALAYNEKAKEFYGEFAYLNVVKLKLRLRKCIE